MEKMATEIFCTSIHTLKLALAEKIQLKCIDNNYNNIKRSKNLNRLTCTEF